MAPSKDQYDCIIVGAGMSGLCCASKLAKRGHGVLVLEARDRIGGRVHTAFGPNGEPVDLGASFVHGVDGNPLAKMAKEHGVKLYPGNMQIIAFKPDGSLLGENTTYTMEGNLYNALFGAAREHSRHQILPPTQSLDSFLKAPDSPLFEGLTDEEKDYAQRLSQSMDKWTGASLDEVSLKYWGFEREFEGPDKVVADGYIHLLEPLRKTIIDYGGQIQLSTTVTSFIHDPEAGLVKLGTNSNTTFTAKSVICTLPLGVLKHSPEIFNPALPPRRLDAISKVGFGLLNKAVLIYPEVWWPADVYVMRIFLPPPSTADEPVRGGAPVPTSGSGGDLPPGLATKGLFVQSYYPLTKRPMLAFFFGGHNGDALERISDESVVNWLHAVLKRCLLKLPGSPEEEDVPSPSSSFVTHWRGDPLSRGTYSYLPVAEEGSGLEEHASPVSLLELSRALWDGRLGFAGEHTEVDHYATVHGPAISGWREADRVHALFKGAWSNN